MERVLRSPHYTELILCDIAGLYLYFKIDCFHIVLPVDEKSECYFNTFRNGLCTDDATEKIYLLQCTRPKQHRYQSCKQNFHADDDELTVHFPDVLMQWNVQFHNDYICEMLNQPSGHKIKDYDIPFILFPGEDHRHNDLDLNVRTNKAAKLASKAKATIDLSDAKKFHLNKLDHKKATEDAANTSPLKVVMVSKAEYKQVLELKVKLGKMKLESEEQQEKISILLSQIDNAIAENQRLRDAYIKLSRDVRRNSETNGQDRRLSLQLAKECLSSYEKTYETLSRRYSAESVRYKGGATHKELREEISANIKRSERLKESTKDMEEVHDDCSRIHEKFKGLLYSRTLSSST